MRRARLSILAVTTVLLTVSACSAMLNLMISGEFDRPEVTFDGGRRACVDHLEVYATGPSRAVLWAVRTEGSRCVKLRRIVYGETPAGFLVVIPVTPLRTDVVYEAFGRGWTKHPLSNVPWAGSVRFHFRDGEWRVLPTSSVVTGPS